MTEPMPELEPVVEPSAESKVGLPRVMWYPLLALFVSMLALASAGVFYANRVAAEEGRKLCSVFTLLDDTYRQTPPQTSTGRRFAAAIRKVVIDLQCGPTRDATPVPTGEVPRSHR